MIKFGDMVNILDMDEDVYIYVSCQDKAMIFNGTLRDMPLDVFLRTKDMNVTSMYPAVDEGVEDKIIPTAHMNIILGW